MNNPTPEGEKQYQISCPHGRLGSVGVPGWKRCPHCLGLNTASRGITEPPKPRSAERSDAKVQDEVQDQSKTKSNPDIEELRQKLASIEHERWADWQKWCHQVLRDQLEPEVLEKLEPVLRRWDRQIATPYSQLSPEEKKSDIEQVDRYWPLIQAFVSAEKRKELERSIEYSKTLPGVYIRPDEREKQRAFSRASVIMATYANDRIKELG